MEVSPNAAGELVARTHEDPTTARKGVEKLLQENEDFQRVIWVTGTLQALGKGEFLLDIQGRQGGDPRRIAAYRMPAGFAGNGTREVARILALLGFGEEEDLLSQIAVPDTLYTFKFPDDA